MEIRWLVDRDDKGVYLVLVVSIRSRQGGFRRRILSANDEWSELDLLQLARDLNQREEDAVNHRGTIEQMKTLREFLGLTLQCADRKSLANEIEERDLAAVKAFNFTSYKMGLPRG
jgi:hypothetical protein